MSVKLYLYISAQLYTVGPIIRSKYEKGKYYMWRQFLWSICFSICNRLGWFLFFPQHVLLVASSKACHLLMRFVHPQLTDLSPLPPPTPPLLPPALSAFCRADNAPRLDHFFCLFFQQLIQPSCLRGGASALHQDISGSLFLDGLPAVRWLPLPPEIKVKV